MSVIEFFYWLTAALGVALSAIGLGGLRLRRNAAIAWKLTDPIGRFDFHFSEGQFDLIVHYVAESFARSAGALILIVSLVLATFQLVSPRATQLESDCTATHLRLAALSLGLMASVPVWWVVRRIAVRKSAAEMEHQASEHVRRRPDTERNVKQTLAWFHKRVGRAPRIRPNDNCVAHH